MRFINRWSLMRNTEIENIQEHSLEVAMVAHNLAALKNEYFGGNVDINKVAVIAMYHEDLKIHYFLPLLLQQRDSCPLQSSLQSHLHFLLRQRPHHYR